MRTRIKATLVGCGAALAVAPQAASATPIHWHVCGDQLPGALQCGEIAVPLDYAAPGAAKIRLGFARLPAQGPAQRLGSLIVNPGGPGGGGSDALVPDATGRHLWHPALHRRFDLIGM